MNTDLNQIAIILKDFRTEVETLKSKQYNLFKRLRKSIDDTKLDKIKKNLEK